MSEEAEIHDKPQRKRLKASNDLKSFSANVKIVVGKGEHKSEHLYHGHQLASISPWIDEQLSDMLKEEKDMYEICLKDITTEEWLAMIKFILSPLEARKMTKEDVMGVVAGYHKYEFTQGLAMCDQILLEYMEILEPQDKDKTLDVGTMVSAISTAHKYHLAKAHKTGAAFFKKILLYHPVGDLNVKQLDFSPLDIEKLVPTMRSLVEEDPTFLSRVLPYISSYQLKSLEDMNNPMFPHMFCMAWYAFYSKKKQKHIQLCGAVWEDNRVEDFTLSWSSSSESYEQYKKKVSIGGQNYYIEVYQCYDSGWKIMGSCDEDVDVDDEVLWKVNVGGKHEIPPESGWQSVHPLASGNPKIKFLGP